MPRNRSAATAARQAAATLPATATHDTHVWALCRQYGDDNRVSEIYDSESLAQRELQRRIAEDRPGSNLNVVKLAATFGSHGYWTICISIYRGEVPEVESLIDSLATNESAGGEGFTPIGYFQSREDAFAEAAEWNLEEIAEFRASPEPNRWNGLWYVVVEIGAIDAPALWSARIDDGSRIGNLSVCSEFAIRRVTPTADELAKYPVPAEFRGHALTAGAA